MVVSGAVGSIGLVSWVGVEALVGVILASHGSGSRATKFGIFVRIERTRSRAEGDRRVVRWVLEWWSLGLSEESIRSVWLGVGALVGVVLECHGSGGRAGVLRCIASVRAVSGREKLEIEVKVKPSGGTAPMARPAAGAKNSDHFGRSPVQWKVCGRKSDVRLGVWETGVNPLR